jgi:hypothetical protein
MRASLFVAISVVLAAPFGQAPELAQQYARRLGGAIDELDHEAAFHIRVLPDRN